MVTAPAESGGGFGGPGRFHVFVANFGGGVARNELYHSAVEHLRNCPGHILALQECAGDLYDYLQQGGWLLTPKEPWVGGITRGRTTPQLCVAGWPTLVSGVEALEKHSGDYEPEKQSSTAPAEKQSSRRSFWLFASVGFKREAAGMQKLTMVNVHLNSQVVASPNSQHVSKIFDEIAKGIRSSGARLLVGDANKGLFATDELMEARGIQCTMVARHCGLDVTSKINVHRPVAEAIKHDTMGVWILGPVCKIRHLSLNARCVLSALHPATIEERDAKGETAMVTVTRGLLPTSFPSLGLSTSATAPAGWRRQCCVDAEPDENYVDNVLRLWDGHKQVAVGEKRDLWRMAWPSLKTRPPENARVAPTESSAAASGSSAPAAPPPPSAPPPAEALEKALEEADKREAKEVRRLLREKLSVLDMLPDFINRGDRFATMMEMLGCPLLRDEVGERTASGVATSTWPLFPPTSEIPCLGEQWDSSGLVWGRSGHFPLLVAVGSYRSYSSDAIEAKNVVKHKRGLWEASGRRSWPWWIYHESEKAYWLPGTESSGRGWSGDWDSRDTRGDGRFVEQVFGRLTCDPVSGEMAHQMAALAWRICHPFVCPLFSGGYWWRHATKHLSKAELQAASQQWIDLYGEEAYHASVAATEWVLECDFPPEPLAAAQPGAKPVRSRGGHIAPPDLATEEARAAWAGPELWHAHCIDPCSLTQMMGLKTQISIRRALPDKLAALRLY